MTDLLYFQSCRYKVTEVGVGVFGAEGVQVEGGLSQ